MNRSFNLWVSGFCSVAAMISFFTGEIVYGSIDLIFSLINFIYWSRRKVN